MKLTLTPPLTPSHWMRSTDLADAASAPLVGTHSADVAIVGGGFVGLWTAITLKQLEPDARSCCWSRTSAAAALPAGTVVS